MVKSLLHHTAAAALALLISSTTAHNIIKDSYTIYELDDEEEGSLNNNKPHKQAKEIDITTPVLCSQELNLYCPPSTTCCPKHVIKSNGSLDSSIKTEREIVGYSCLVSWSSAVQQGPCCDHQIVDKNSDVSSQFGSGCASGYTCAAPLTNVVDGSTLNTSNEQQTIDPLTNTPHCKRDDNPSTKQLTDKRGRPINTDYQYMPRYTTCPAFNPTDGINDIGKPYGLPIPLASASYDKSSLKGGGGVSSSNDVKLNNMERMKANTVTDDDNDSYIGQLAYFTNMGPLTTNPEDLHSHHEGVTTAVIGIHGSGRDAGSYLCALIAAVGEGDVSDDSSNLEEELLKSMEGVSTTQRRRRVQSDNDSGSLKEKERTLVIAPWFLAPSDGQPQSSTPTTSTASSLPFLQWADRAPVSHTFRYGAESISVPPPAAEDVSSSSTTTISSYGAMDVLLETLCNKKNYPNLQRIVVAGHSAGGQFVHRWGLSSDSWCFGDRHGQPEGADGLVASLPSIRVVAANPRSYAYLDKRRYFPTADESTVTLSEQTEEEDKDTLSPFNKLDFRLPTTSEFDDCQEYNQYCWGLQDNPNVPAPYITNNVNKNNMGDDASDSDDDNTSLFCRYASRDVVYLSGQRDIKQLGNQICDEDGYQGPSRRERSERFYASLQVQGGEVLSSCQGSSDTLPPDKAQIHDRIVVQDVGHDHALIFQSKEGKKGMFSDPALN